MTHFVFEVKQIQPRQEKRKRERCLTAPPRVLRLIRRERIRSPFSAGTDLPDDDYTTLVPHSKPINGTTQKSSQIPIIIEGSKNDSKPKKGNAANKFS